MNIRRSKFAINTIKQRYEKTNWYTNIGVGFIALAVLLKVFNLEHNAIIFIQGFSIGLGLVLIVRGFLARKKERYR